MVKNPDASIHTSSAQTHIIRKKAAQPFAQSYTSSKTSKQGGTIRSLPSMGFGGENKSKFGESTTLQSFGRRRRMPIQPSLMQSRGREPESADFQKYTFVPRHYRCEFYSRLLTRPQTSNMNAGSHDESVQTRDTHLVHLVV